MASQIMAKKGLSIQWEANNDMILFGYKSSRLNGDFKDRKRYFSCAQQNVRKIAKQIIAY